MDSALLSISQAAKFIGVSIDTLRRWDSVGRLRSIRSGSKGHRYYRKQDLEQYTQDIEFTARNWVESSVGLYPDPSYYCQTRDVFQARLEKLESELTKYTSVEKLSLLIAIAGEIGNNSFDHNLGNWTDVIGIFFAYTLRERKIILVDRGQGLLKTLKRVRPELSNAQEALKVAFTEKISGRYPEARGNGLKFIHEIIVNNPISLFFKSGNAQLILQQGASELHITQSQLEIHGCLAVIHFEHYI